MTEAIIATTRPTTAEEAADYLRRITAALATEEARLALIMAATTTGRETPPGVPAPSRADMLRALSERPVVEARVRLLEAEREDAQRDVHTLTKSENGRRREELNAAMRPLVAELARVLRQAAAVNSRVEAAQGELLGRHGASPIAWPDFSLGRLAQWEHDMKISGLLAEGAKS